MTLPARTRRRGLLAGLVASLLLASMLAGAQSAAQAAGAYCGLTGMTVNRWTGAADHTTWNNGGNWTLGRPPNNTDTATGYVCINTSDTILLKAGESAQLQAIDVNGSATLNLATGSALYVFGAQGSRASTFRANTTVHMAGILGGPGRYDLLGHMSWTSGPTGASTMTSRICGVPGNCGSPAPTPGLLSVSDAGVLDVDNLGVNLFDSYRIVVRGLMVLSGAGAYVSADRGTTLELRPKSGGGGVGELRLANDGGWYEGFTRYGITTLSTLINAGLIHKSAGSGTSVISATYSRVGAGTARVDSGTLALPPNVTHSVQVAAADTYGFGDCATPAYGCQPVADTAEPQTTTVTTPAGDADGVGLVVQKLTASAPAGSFTAPVQVTATGLAATAADPALLDLRYDASVIGGKTIAQITVKRRPDGATAYATVPACLASGAPPVGSVACVDRRGLPTSSRILGDGDALMVVRTQGFSRWVAL